MQTNLFSNGAEVAVEAALKAQQELHLVVDDSLQSFIDRRDVERDGLPIATGAQCGQAEKNGQVQWCKGSRPG